MFLTENDSFENPETLKFVVNEAYFGENELTDKGVKLVDLLLDKVAGKPFDAIGTEYVELDELGRVLAKLFNCESVLISLHRSTKMGAFTIPLTADVFKSVNDFKLVQGRYGVQWANSKNKKISVVITTGLLTDFLGSQNTDEKGRPIKLKAREIFGIILHEVGHNFYVTQYNVFAHKVNTLLGPLNTLLSGDIGATVGATVGSLLITSSGSRNSIQKVYDALTRNKEGGTVIGVLALISDIRESLRMFYTSFLYMAHFLLALRTYPEHLMKLNLFFLSGIATSLILGQHRNEQFSDSFATSYGFGPDLASGLTKMETSNVFIGFEIMNKIPPLKFLVLNTLYIFSFVEKFFYPVHPASEQRVISQRKMMEQELKSSSITGKQRKELEEKIEEVRQVEKTYKDPDRYVKNLEIFKAGVQYILNFLNLDTMTLLDILERDQYGRGVLDNLEKVE